MFVVGDKVTLAISNYIIANICSAVKLLTLSSAAIELPRIPACYPKVSNTVWRLVYREDSTDYMQVYEVTDSPAKDRRTDAAPHRTRWKVTQHNSTDDDIYPALWLSRALSSINEVMPYVEQSLISAIRRKVSQGQLPVSAISEVENGAEAMRKSRFRLPPGYGILRYDRNGEIQ